MKQYDVIVAGGGMSGVAAAVSAARRGCSVLLVEQTGALGGQGTNGQVNVVMASLQWFYGFGKELMDSLIKEGSAWLIPNPAVKGFRYYPFYGEKMKLALDRAVIKSGAELLLYTKIFGMEKDGDRITTLHLASTGGNFTVQGKVFIDATGDAMLSLYAKEEVAVGDENGDIQAPTMVAGYAGIDFDRYEEFLKTYDDGKKVPKINMIHHLVPKAVEAGVVSTVDLHHPGIFRHTPMAESGIMNAGHVYGASVDSPQGITAATLQGREIAEEYQQFYRRYIPGFENAYITATGAVLALRESRRLVGRYVTTFDDKSSYAKFDDGIMRFDGGAVSDVHASSADPAAYKAYVELYKDREKVRTDDWALLPYRSLLPKKSENLLVAGRCVSADRKVLGQIRLMGYCFMMGEAAGTAAALAVATTDGRVDQIDVKKLQDQLKENGVLTL
ncbi:MAG: FAD-dependent oxidoreductase [Clostridiales bacterium]|nr:FAD-dependent oxidoreductase [Clostridiales bacterium]